MHRLTLLTVASLLALSTACGGGKKPAENASDKSDTTEDKKDESADTDKGKDKDKKDDSASSGDGSGAAPAEKKDECAGFEIGNVEDVLLKVACEEPGVKPDSMTPVDLKGKLEVTASASPSKMPAGAKGEFIVTFTNKTKGPLNLHFRIDPVARFETEAYDKKGKRIDMPTGKPPPPPKGASQPPASEAKMAKITLAANGSARARVPWEAVKMRWAPEKFKGTPPERGYPRMPAGPLGKGKYIVKVVTPLVGVFEGIDHEVSAPKVEIEIEK